MRPTSRFTPRLAKWTDLIPSNDSVPMKMLWHDLVKLKAVLSSEVDFRPITRLSRINDMICDSRFLATASIGGYAPRHACQ